VRLEGHAVIAPDPGLGSPPVTIVSPALKLVLAPVLFGHDARPSSRSRRVTLSAERSSIRRTRALVRDPADPEQSQPKVVGIKRLERFRDGLAEARPPDDGQLLTWPSRFARCLPPDLRIRFGS
jgi:hypothetical protein